MIKTVKILIFTLLLCLVAEQATWAQIVKDNSEWTFEAKKKKDKEYELIVHLKLPKGWHIYALKPGGDGSLIAPAFTYKKDAKVTLTGSVSEKGKLISETLPGMDGVVNMYKGNVDYIQKATISGNTTLKVTCDYQICDDNMCLPPTTKVLEAKITDAGGADTSATRASEADTNKTAIANPPTATKDTAPKATISPANTPPEAKKDNSLLGLFLAGLGAGLLALLTPCIYSMVPITVSFFTKRSKSRKEGIKNAILYSLSIIIIFTLLGVLITAIFGGTALNSLSTDWRANLFFFTLFCVFGVSFLGAFEITLPSSLANSVDSKANTSGFGGIFFMALTLTIVSFSCTGPIVGGILVQASQGNILGPTVAMFGFSLGLAVPFSLLAVFPGLINKMATAGGWMNQVKVVLGFLELAFALKFFSNADLVQGWRLLDREVFIAIWVVLSLMVGFYLLGKFKLKHDDAPPQNDYGQEYVSIFKLILSIIFFSFAVYLLPGMWGAPLNGMSQFIPPMATFDQFGGGTGGASAHSNNLPDDIKPKKYVDVLKIYEPPVVVNEGLVVYYDLDEAIAASIKLKKPIMLDFTGIACVNCRKMESQVWSKPEVSKRLKNDFVVVSLYCDMNRITLPESEQYFSKALNQKILTLGNKYADIQATRFNTNAQPYYFYIDEKGNKLAENGYGYDPDVDKFVKHLDGVKANYAKTHP